MGWNANSVSDETLHRRRIVVAALGILGALIVIVSTLMDTNQGISAKDFLCVLWSLALAAYFASMAVSEWQQLRGDG